ncbi:MAG: CvpA family protein [Chloroflexi bacterium]|nr:CvpA family protein [Chloroflexota bacterium]
MNFLDWILIAIIVLASLWGLRKGLVDAVLMAVSLYVALFLSGLFAGRVLSLVWKDVDNQAIATAIGYVVIFIGVYIASSIVSKIIKSSLKKVKFGWIDTVGGVLVGLIAGLLLTGGLMAVAARYTYVVDEKGAGVEDGPGGLSAEAVIRQLRQAAESFLVGSSRDAIDGQLTKSEVIGVLIDIRNVLPGSALGMYPEEFNTAIDILESKRDLMSDSTAAIERPWHWESEAV